MTSIELDMIQTAGIGALALLVGMVLTRKVAFLQKFCVPSNDTATSNHPYNASVINEKMIPPLTGDGTQNFWRKVIFRVMTIPARSAKAPMPAVCIISSSILTILTLFYDFRIYTATSNWQHVC
jgi:hypothetical protein